LKVCYQFVAVVVVAKKGRDMPLRYMAFTLINLEKYTLQPIKISVAIPQDEGHMT
jgi:hypothetical protein